MSMADHVAIVVETQRIDSGCSLENEFNVVDSCHNCISVDGRLCFDYD